MLRPTKILISYRRSDSLATTGRLDDHLVRHFGRGQVFRDIDSLRPGVDFVKSIEESLSECNVLLVMIGKNWFDAPDSEGSRRLDDPDDYVRREIAMALAREGVLVIPILVDSAELPAEAQLPEDISDLVRRHALTLSNERFDSDVSKIIREIREYGSTPIGKLARYLQPYSSHAVAATVLVAAAVALSVIYLEVKHTESAQGGVIAELQNRISVLIETTKKLARRAEGAISGQSDSRTPASEQETGLDIDDRDFKIEAQNAERASRAKATASTQVERSQPEPASSKPVAGGKNGATVTSVAATSPQQEKPSSPFDYELYRCEQALKSVEQEVQFGLWSARIKKSKGLIKVVDAFSNACTNRRVIIQDRSIAQLRTRKARERLIRLSRQRLDSLAEYLTANGVDPKQIIPFPRPRRYSQRLDPKQERSVVKFVAAAERFK